MPTELLAADFEEYEERCFTLAQELHRNPDLRNIRTMLDQHKGFESAMHKLGIFLAKSVRDLLTSCSPSKRSVTGIISKLNGGARFRIRLGLIAIIDLSGYWSEDQGQVIFRFPVGLRSEWERHVRLTSKTKWHGRVAAKTFWATQARVLCETGVRLGERVFSSKNASGFLLSSECSDAVGDELRVVLPYKPSSGGAGRKGRFRRDYPWALVSSKHAFPQVYALANAAQKPVGFLQCATVLPAAWTGRRGSIYKGRYSSWIHMYKPDLPWARSLRRLIWTFTAVLLSPVLSLVNDLLTIRRHLRDQRRYFPREFRTAVGIGEGQNVRDGAFKDSRWVEPIAECHACLQHVRASPTHISVGITQHLWRECHRETQEFTLARRADAEAMLFWNPKYREHLVL